MSTQVTVPSFSALLWPTLRAVRAIGDSGTIEEIDEKVLEQEDLSEEQQAVLHNGGPRTKVEYRLAWARSHLKGMGLLDNSTRGVWAATEKGRVVAEGSIGQMHRDYRQRLRDQRRQKQFEDLPFDETLENNTNVTGRSGDGGIDGVGTYRVSLVSFPVYFQCKRYQGSVGPDKVRDFRGAISGRGDRGLLITTATFTREAKREASRDGATPLIDLIDGEGLCDLLKELQLGVRTVLRTVEDVEVNAGFFADL
jgi:restriction system protein